MDEKQAFLQAIIDDPDDDALRLIYADWLDDHGESERAELIRVQCDLASLSISDPRYAQLEDRSDELLFLHEKEWVEIGTVISDLNWSRGFVEDLLLKNGRALEDAQSAFEQHPIRNVFFGPPTQIDPASLLDSPFLDRLRSMSMGFYDPFEMPESLFTLLSSSQVKDLEKLDLSWGQSRDFMTELCKQSNAPRLMHLGLEELSTEDALSVFSPHFERLTDLDSTE